MIVGIALLILQFILGTVYVKNLVAECGGIRDEGEAPCDVGIAKSISLHGIYKSVLPTFIGLELMFISIQSTLLVVMFIICKDLTLLMIYFHDYLIAYK